MSIKNGRCKYFFLWIYGRIVEKFANSWPLPDNKHSRDLENKKICFFRLIMKSVSVKAIRCIEVHREWSRVRLVQSQLIINTIIPISSSNIPLYEDNVKLRKVFFC